MTVTVEAIREALKQLAPGDSCLRFTERLSTEHEGATEFTIEAL